MYDYGSLLVLITPFIEYVLKVTLFIGQEKSEFSQEF